MHGADIGAGALIAGLVAAICSIAAGILGSRSGDEHLLRAARNGAYVVTGMIVLASSTLVYAFITHDFSLAYVTSNSSRSMPAQYVIASFYSGQQGSLLYWSLALSIFAAFAVHSTYERLRALIGYAIAVLMGIEAFFLTILVFVASPFERLPITPIDGRGLNPLLYDQGMLIHPPMLLLGYASVGVPYAFAMAALLAGRTDADWMRATRRFALFAWAFLGFGNLLGAWWAYHVLGWGGYWGWDPVENSAIMPWLALTAYIHSVMVQQRRGMLKIWNMALVIATFCLAIQGTFIVRSGIISSVHSFAQSTIGPYFFGFLAVIVIGSITALLYRVKQLRDTEQFEGLMSRESGFLLNNVLLVGIAFATYWGTIFPVLSEAVRGMKATVGAPFYRQVNGPLLLALIILMGIGPLLPWRRATTQQLRRTFLIPMALAGVATLVLLLLGIRDVAALVALIAAVFAAATVFSEYWRGIRARMRSTHEWVVPAVIHLVSRAKPRYGGYLVHLGIALMAVGIVSSQVYQQTREVTLSKGDSLTIGRYTLTNQGVATTFEADVRKVTATVALSEDGGPARIVYPGKIFYANFNDQPATHVAIETTQRLEDVYMVLTGWGDDDQTISILAIINPMVILIWAGGLILLFGSVVSLWPEHSPAIQPLPARVREPLRAPSPSGASPASSPSGSGAG